MRKSWVSDAIMGLVLTLIVALGYLVPSIFPFFEGIELKAFDKRSKLRQNLDPSSEIVLITIDDASIAQGGRWPWPRLRLAALLDKLASVHSRVVVLDIVFSEPEPNQGLIEIENLQSQYRQLKSARKIIDQGGAFDALLSLAAQRLDSDSQLQASLERARNVVLPMFFAQGATIGAGSQPLPTVLSSAALSHQVAPGAFEEAMPEGIRAVFPIAPFAQAAMGVGSVNVEPDFDGVVRRQSVVTRYFQSYLPSYPLEIALAYLGIRPAGATFVWGRELRFAKSVIPLDEHNQMLITFNGPAQTFRCYSYRDVIQNNVSLDFFKDKIVLVGLTAARAAIFHATPISRSLSSIEMTANVVENMLHKKFLVRPPWAQRVEWGLIVLAALFIMVCLPCLELVWGAALSFLMMLLIMGAGTYFFVNGQWIKATYPCALLGLGYLAIALKRFFAAEKDKDSKPDSGPL